MKVDVTCLRFFIIKMTVFTVECTLHYISVLRTALLSPEYGSMLLVMLQFNVNQLNARGTGTGNVE